MECAKAILSGRTLEQAKAIIRFHLEHPSEFYSTHSLYGLTHIRKDCNQILARMTRPNPTPDVPKSTKQTLEAVATFLGKPEDNPW